jgi:hypothetical protein
MPTAKGLAASAASTVPLGTVLREYDSVRASLSALTKRKEELRTEIETRLKEARKDRLEEDGFFGERRREEREFLDKEGVIAKYGRRALGKLLEKRASWRVDVGKVA